MKQRKAIGLERIKMQMSLRVRLDMQSALLANGGQLAKQLARG